MVLRKVCMGYCGAPGMFQPGGSRKPELSFGVKFIQARRERKGILLRRQSMGMIMPTWNSIVSLGTCKPFNVIKSQHMKEQRVRLRAGIVCRDQIREPGVHPIGTLKQSRFPCQMSRGNEREKARVVRIFLICPVPSLVLANISVSDHCIEII